MVGVRDMGVDQLADYLLYHQVPLAAVDKLKEEEINGRAFLRLTQSDFKEMEIKIGHRKTIQALIEDELQESFSTTNKPPDCSISDLIPEVNRLKDLSKPGENLTEKNVDGELRASNNLLPKVNVGWQQDTPSQLMTSLEFEKSFPSTLALDSRSPRNFLKPDEQFLAGNVSGDTKKSNHVPVRRYKRRLQSLPKELEQTKGSSVDQKCPRESEGSVPGKSHRVSARKNKGQHWKYSQALLRPSDLNITKILKAHKDGHIVLKGLQKKTLLAAERNLLVRIICDYVVEKLKRTPQVEEKEAMAVAIVHAYPSLRKNSKCGYEYFFDKTSGLGLIEYYFNASRAALSPEAKKNLRGKSKGLPNQESIKSEDKSCSSLTVNDTDRLKPPKCIRIKKEMDDAEVYSDGRKEADPMVHSFQQKLLLHSRGKSLTFTSSGEYVPHKKKPSIPSTVNSTEVLFFCGICNKYFKEKKYLNKHEKIHSVEKPFSCQVCSKAFARKDHMLNHSRIHTKERSFTCGVCDQRFKQRKHYKRHLQLHNENELSCAPSVEKDIQNISKCTEETVFKGESEHPVQNIYQFESVLPKQSVDQGQSMFTEQNKVYRVQTLYQEPAVYRVFQT